jgi:hypothetical protein
MPTKRTAGRLAAIAAGIIAVASVAGAVSATALALTGGSPAARPAAAHHGCRPAALELRLAGTDTGTGSTALTVVITNRSAAACSLQGYPALRLARPGGSMARARIAPGRGPLFAGMSRAQVRLRPGGQASFFLVYRDFNGRTGRPGPAISALRVGLRGVPGQFTVRAQIAPFGPLSVSPVRPGAGKE